MRKKIFILAIVLVLAGIFFSFRFLYNKQINNNSSEISTQIQGQIAGVLTNTGELYKNKDLGFSFLVPEGYSVHEIKQEHATIILVESERSNSSFQILISTFNEPGAVITKETIQKDIPDIKIEQEKAISFEGVTGLEFFSNNEVFEGQSFEVWFVHGLKLYQITGYSSAKVKIEKVLENWKF